MASVGAFLKDWAKPRHALVAFAALILIPALASVLLHWAAVPISTTEDPFGLATTLAAIMGGIFVVGGLVVILGSIATATTIDEKLKAAKEELEATIRVQRFREIDLYFKAREIIVYPDPMRSMAELDEFLSTNQDVPRARYLLAERLFGIVRAQFKEKHHMQHPAKPYVLLSDAISWAHKARDLEKDNQLKAKAISVDALMVAVQGDNTGMLSRLQTTIDGISVAKSQAPYLSHASTLAMLVNACRTEFQLKELGRILGRPLPIPMEAITQDQPLYGNTWWVQAKSLADWPDNPGVFPRVIHFYLQPEEVRRGVIHLVATDPVKPATIQHKELTPPDIRGKSNMKLHDFLAALDRSYFLICPFEEG